METDRKMVDIDSLQAKRLALWGQTPEARIPDPDAAVPFIERVGVATLFPASPELPNLFHAYTGDPDARIESEWDSPAGQVYGWRWALGRREAAFYTAVARNRPTLVAWPLLPAVLRLRGDLRAVDEIYHTGVLSSAAYRLATALEEAGGVLSTGELRKRAGFPTGKAERAAYLKAVEELDTRLLLAKVFSTEDDDMRHALVRDRYPEHVAAAERMSLDDALDLFLATYLPNAAYTVPPVLARHLKLDGAALCAGLDRLVAEGKAETVAIPGQKGVCYTWAGQGLL